MQFKLAVLASLAAAASANYTNGTQNATWVTTTVSVLTTVCPAATSLTFNGVTYTATASQTITITNCPCTISYLPTVTPVVSATKGFSNSTTMATATTAGTVVPPTSTKAPIVTGGANKAFAGSAAGLAGLIGLAAYVL